MMRFNLHDWFWIVGGDGARGEIVITYEPKLPGKYRMFMVFN